MNENRKKAVTKRYANSDVGLRLLDDELHVFLNDGYEVQHLTSNSKNIIVLYRWVEKSYRVAAATLGFDEMDVG
jgi:hypothetical protein